MKTTFLRLATLALVMAMAGGAAVAQDATTTAPAHPHGDRAFGGPGFGGPMFGFGHQLGLTDAQKAQMKEIMTKERPTLKPLMQQAGQGQAQLRQLELSGNFNEEQARAIAMQQTQAMADLSVQRARIEAEMIQVLTPDQKAKLTQMWQRREQHLGAGENQEAPAQ
jgi:protein CpxP